MILKDIPIELIDENNYNPNIMTLDQLEHLKEEYKRVGYLQPIVCRPKGNRYEIIDGAHRLRAYQVLNNKVISSVVVNMTDTEAKLTTINMNQIKGETDPLKMANLINDLSLTLDMNEIDRILKISESEQEAFKALLNIPDEMLEILPLEKQREYIICPDCNKKIYLDEVEVNGEPENKK